MTTSKSSPSNCREEPPLESPQSPSDGLKGDAQNMGQNIRVTFGLSDLSTEEVGGATAVGPLAADSPEKGPPTEWRHLNPDHVHAPDCHWNYQGPLLPCPDCSKTEHICHKGPPSPLLRRAAHAPSDCPCHTPGSGTDPLHCRCHCHMDRATSSPNIDSHNYDHLQALRMQYKSWAQCTWRRAPGIELIWGPWETGHTLQLFQLVEFSAHMP